MSSLKLFKINGTKASEVPGEGFALERPLQRLMEENLEVLLGVKFLASEYTTGTQHGGRIDTLGLDENGCPVIIEYKRSLNENVINQGLYYLDWLLDHKAEFQLLVLKQIAQGASDEIDWSAPRLLCIAGDFTKFDEHAIKQMNRNIELLRYRRFGDDLLLLELVNQPSGEVARSQASNDPAKYKTVEQNIASLDSQTAQLYDALKTHLESLGDDVQVKMTRAYVAFKRLQNFASVEVRTTKRSILLYLKVDPQAIDLQEGFTRDVTNIGHFGTGDLEVTLTKMDDLERAKPLIQRSYEAS